MHYSLKVSRLHSTARYADRCFDGRLLRARGAVLRPGGLGNRSVLRQGLQNFEHSNEVGGVVGGAEFEIESEHQGLAAVFGNVIGDVGGDFDDAAFRLRDFCGSDRNLHTASSPTRSVSAAIAVSKVLF